MIAIGSDHAGFELKEKLRAILIAGGHDVLDVGTCSEASVDYPDFGIKVAEKVSAGEAERGVLVCGSGIGMSIVANKFPRVRAALCFDAEMAKMCRLHNDANILVLPGRWIGAEQALTMLAVWMETAFEGGRHALRLEKIAELEGRLNCK